LPVVHEARLEHTEQGVRPVSDGWFVLNLRDGLWETNEALGAVTYFENDQVSFPQVGYTIVVLEPGQFSRYHREANQEDFLVLAGRCLLLVEGEERELRAWDLVHCPPNTEHGFVASGDERCVLFATGSRRTSGQIVYPRSDLALRHGSGVETETTVPAEAYAPLPKWQPGRPESWDELPWA
jgi:quercetin dioxygenase-like cupin family protein